MKLKSISIFYITLFFILFSSPVAAKEVHHADIKIDHKTFEESINKLSEIFGTEIILLGIKNLPQHKFSLTLEQATFEQATKKAIQMAGLQSHAFVWDQQKNITRIWIFKGNTADWTSHSDNDKTQKTMFEPSENFRMMTKEEYDNLEPDSQQDFRGMTSEEFENLEPDESKNFTMMTQEEYNRLEPDSQQDLRGMTSEEFETLEPAEPEDSKMMTQEEFDRLETE
jgi:hypothetical protein